MKNTVVSLLIAAAPQDTSVRSDFTRTVMKQIKAGDSETFTNQVRTTRAKSNWSTIMNLIHKHKLIFGVFALVMMASLSFTSYAYAIGSNPVSLIKRWIEGDTVKIEYKGRSFEHGKKLSYSDAAVTAYAELRTTEGLHFNASNQVTVPKNGVEYVSNPFDPSYEYPWIGTIESISGDSVTLRKQYILGDKMTKSNAAKEQVSILLGELRLYGEGEPIKAGPSVKGKTVVVYSDKYLRHTQGSKSKPTAVNLRFTFITSHSLASFKEADQANAAGHDQAVATGDKAQIFEPSWGGLTNICINNGADTCSEKVLSNEGQSLYGAQKSPDGNVYNENNPNVIAFGEAVTNSGEGRDDLIMRGIDGKISAIDINNLTITTSSGGIWKLEYSEANQNSFKRQWGSSLKLGDRIGGNILESVYTLDNRSIRTEFIYSLARI